VGELPNSHGWTLTNKSYDIHGIRSGLFIAILQGNVRSQTLVLVESHSKANRKKFALTTSKYFRWNMRKQPLNTGDIYHVFTKSIAGFKIFRTKRDYQRMIELIKFYRIKKPPTRFSTYIEIKDKEQFITKYIAEKGHIVEINAYCLMPTHIHLILRQLKKDGISIFMGKVLNSYTRFFNLKNKRKGPFAPCHSHSLKTLLKNNAICKLGLLKYDKIVK